MSKKNQIESAHMPKEIGQYDENTQTLIRRKEKIYKDIETGEVFDITELTKIAYGQKSFWKLYLNDFLNVLGLIDNKQLNVIRYVLKNTNPTQNTYIGTMRQTAEGAKVSLETVRKTFSLLVKKTKGAPALLKKLQNGVYLVNPEILVKGNDFKRKTLLKKWYGDKPFEFEQTENAETESKAKK